jgi:Flp pilus assembly protein TadD
MGVEHMQAGHTAQAFLHFRKALLEHDAEFSPAWTNLGTLYSRNGHLEFAEAAYLRALEANAEDLVAMSNLARLYDREGKSELAESTRRKVEKHRYRNPYFRFQLALNAYKETNYDEAIGHLTYAVRKQRNEDRFYSLLGLCYLQKGNQQKARQWLKKAQRVAATDAQKRRYMAKMDVLLKDNSEF